MIKTINIYLKNINKKTELERIKTKLSNLLANRGFYTNCKEESIKFKFDNIKKQTFIETNVSKENLFIIEHFLLKNELLDYEKISI